MNVNMVLTLKQFTDEDLKSELARRRTLERARRHLNSAEAALARAEEKVSRYRQVLVDEDQVSRKRETQRA